MTTAPSDMSVTPEMIEAGVKALNTSDLAHYDSRSAEDAAKALYVYAAMRSATPSPDRTLVERELLNSPVIEFLLGHGPLMGCHFGDEPPEGERGNFWWRKHLRAALSAMPEASDLERKWPRYEAALRNARAWVFECWGWLMETDLDMKCPMEVDPLDIVEQIDALLGIDPVAPKESAL